MPDDGAQVRFDLELIVSSGDRQNTAAGALTVSSVGQVTENGEKYRWIDGQVTASGTFKLTPVDTSTTAPSELPGKN